MATLSQTWTGKKCPHENVCECRHGNWCPQANLSTRERYHPMLHLAGCSFAYKGCYCRILEEVENLSLEFLKEAGIDKPPVPLDVIDLFDSQKSIEIRYLPLKRYLGCTWSIDDEWVVYINENLGPELRNFTAFHEGFHIICGSSGLVFKDNKHGHKAVSERLADYFASCILMPGELVSEHWAEIKSLNKMASIFSVPKQELQQRLLRLHKLTV